MSLGALIRRYHVAEVPIRWYGRNWGSSNLKLRQMGRRYLSTLLMLFFQRVLIADDLMAERLASNAGYHRSIADLQERLEGLEKRVDALHAEAGLNEAEPGWTGGRGVPLVPRKG
jgi:dolichol-phosphate mannosyltransferase